MCGRYAMTTSAADLTSLFAAVDETGGGLRTSYNVAPTQTIAIVRTSAGGDGRLLSLAQWGMVPPWARSGRAGKLIINARAETVASSKMFSSSFAARRCVVPADGWYEWARSGDGRKQPYFMAGNEQRVLGFAGIWAPFRLREDETMMCCVVTTQAVGTLAQIHDRMPLVLPRQRWGAWIGGDGDLGEDPAVLLRPADQEMISSIESRPVAPRVGDVRNDGPELVREWLPDPSASGSEAEPQASDPLTLF
ncbi:MAG: SOS response-associated peptidase [Micromonosporaceae bacterium]|nr:SOS response-associated peptidase [Micromonosporaceae bacterium]